MGKGSIALTTRIHAPSIREYFTQAINGYEDMTNTQLR